MRIHEKWPKGHGVDREFWDKQKLWYLSDAAAISLGVDPRVCYSDAGTKDPAFHGGPKLAENQVPGLVSEIENLVIMATNGLLPVLKDGVSDSEDKAWWRIRPADYWDSIGNDQAANFDDPMIHKRLITGSELLERWNMAPFELLAQVKAGDITPFFEFAGARRTPGNDPCLYCAPPIEHEGSRMPPPCIKRPAESGAWPGGCHKGNTAAQARNLLSALFFFSEVQSYEQAHGVRLWTQAGHEAANTETLTETPHAAGITGAMIAKRWQGHGLDLLTALRSGELAPVDKIVAAGETCGPRRTKEMDPCLYCEDGPVGCECEHLEQDDFCTHWSHEGRMFRVRHAIFLRHDVLEYELSKGVTIKDESQNEQLLPAAFADAIKSGQDQQNDEPARNFKTPKEFADHHRSIEGWPVGWVMLALVEQWGLKNYEAAAVALGDPVPEKGSDAAKSYGGRFRYHTKLLNQDK